MNENIDSMIKSLIALKNAFNNVNKAWDQCSHMNELKLSDYPFEYSFDELNIIVENWINKSILELQNIKE